MNAQDVSVLEDSLCEWLDDATAELNEKVKALDDYAKRTLPPEDYARYIKETQ